MKIEQNASEDKLVVTIEGEVDEDAAFESLNFDGIKHVTINLEKVHSINSCGIRTWFHWIREIPADIQISYEKCPQIIVDQINISKGFLPPRAKVSSFFVPYHCDECGADHSIVLTRGEDFHEAQDGSEDWIKVEDVQVCPNCGGEMDIDVINAKYFKFLK